jgi:hypothetical protein
MELFVEIWRNTANPNWDKSSGDWSTNSASPGQGQPTRLRMTFVRDVGAGLRCASPLMRLGSLPFLNRRGKSETGSSTLRPSRTVGFHQWALA